MFFIVFLETNKRMRASLRGRRKCWVAGRMLEILTSLRHAPAVVPSLTHIKQMLSAYGHNAEPARCHWRPITPSPRCDDAIQVQGHRFLSEQGLHRGWRGHHASHPSASNLCERVGFYLQYAVPVAGNRAVNIQHIIFGVDPPNLEHKEQMQELKLFTKQVFFGGGSGELRYLQSKSCDVNISQHAGHLFSFKNLCRVLHEHQTCSHYCATATENHKNWRVWVGLTPPGPEAPGLRWVLVCPWLAGWPLNPQRFITPWNPLPILHVREENNQ